MKAYVKINITIHFEGDSPFDGTKFPLSVHQAGVVDVTDVEEGRRVVEALNNHVASTFHSMGVKPIPASPPPDFSQAFGGLPEHGPEKNGNGAA